MTTKEKPNQGKSAGLKSGRLPPDPEAMNDSRAGWAAAAIGVFRDETGADFEDAVCDLLADLMHWCDRNGQSFAAELSRARSHYEAETAPPGED
jgi:hypothetical protein